MPAGMASVINHAVSRHYLSWRTSPRVWGDGFADLSLSTSLYPRDWSDVSDDELVLFFSHLSGQDHPELGIAARLRAAYARRVRASAILRAENGANLYERTAADGRHLDDDLAMAPPSPEELAIVELFALDLARPPWASEAAIIGAIDRMLCEASSAGGKTANLNEALLASIHTAINAAYVYPAHAFAHEVLATGAWFGTLLMGRPALMPLLVAHTCIDCLDGIRQDPISEILKFHVARLGGSSLFLRHAHKTIKSGRSSVVPARRL
jgi:hypothetical protein